MNYRIFVLSIKQNRKFNIMTITKLSKTIVPVEHQAEEGCVAFQKVKFEHSFYGSKQSDIIDTKILHCGKQVVISGNGFIKDGADIKTLNK